MSVIFFYQLERFYVDDKGPVIVVCDKKRSVLEKH